MSTTTDPHARHAHSAPESLEELTLPVSGMSCAACQTRVQRALQRTPGVADASVNLMMGNAAVRFDPAVADRDVLVAAIRSSGYDSPERAAQHHDPLAEQLELDAEQERDYRSLRRKAIWSLVAGAVAMLISMPLMAGDAHVGGDPLMRWVMHRITPPLEAAFPWLYRIPAPALSWTLLFLTLAVMLWAGRHFYRRAWISFRQHGADMDTLIAVGTGAAFLWS
ncbi:MAG TPA: cation transporter, partial [Gemmatimonadales bacterium]|nr:cation transporter [Gemmatimonadales bacterium]